MLWRRPVEATEWIRQASQLARQVGDRFYIAMTTYQIGHVLGHIEPTDAAVGYLRNSYALFEELEDARMAGWSALYLGRCLRGLQRFDEAADWTVASSLLASTINHRRQIAYALVQLCRLRVAQGQPAKARWYLEQAKRHFPKAIEDAPDEAPWEPRLEVIRDQVVGLAGVADDNTLDSAQELVMVILGRTDTWESGYI
jgi:ATP/maltotriose-dependent transcriptional regulator MalT